jgi:peptidoglycan/LPS O-acetylase OafA/YrhL
MSSSNRTIPALDGLRAISIGLVVLVHASATHGCPWMKLELGRFVSANFGVRVFFVISGYLITHLLLRESERTGTIRIGRFYLRRTFRIFPAYYVLLAIIALLAATDVIGLRPGDLLHSLTYTQNYAVKPSWWVAHTWSLAVEEQFYLLWPATLLVLGVHNGLRTAAAYLLLAPVLRWWLWFHTPSWYSGTSYSFEVVADAIATGCVLAGVREKLWDLAGYRALLRSRWFALVPLAAWALTASSWARFNSWIGLSLTNVGIALTIDACLRSPHSLPVRVLDSPLFTFIGRRSYSLYLWQQLFLVREDLFPAGAPVPWCATFPWNVGLALLASCASYAWIEQPFLKLRDQVEARMNRRTASTPRMGSP